jgi:hypothetical protein
MIKRETILLTIRQAVKHVFPYATPQMIHHWLLQGVFRPIKYSPGVAGRGPGRGCLLDFYDLVVVEVLSSLLTWGARFSHIRLPSGGVPTTSWAFVEKRFSQQQLFKLHTAWSQGRAFQEFLRLTDCKALLYAERSRISPADSSPGLVLIDPKKRLSRDTMLSVRVFRPEDKLTFDEYFSHVTAKRLVLGHLFINCVEARDYVEERLKLKS